MRFFSVFVRFFVLGKVKEKGLNSKRAAKCLFFVVYLFGRFVVVAPVKVLIVSMPAGASVCGELLLQSVWEIRLCLHPISDKYIFEVYI